MAPSNQLVVWTHVFIVDLEFLAYAGAVTNRTTEFQLPITGGYRPQQYAVHYSAMPVLSGASWWVLNKQQAGTRQPVCSPAYGFTPCKPSESLI